MRRLVALLSAGVLVASLAGSAAATPAVPHSSSFVGNFEMINPDDGTVTGWAKVEIRMATETNLVPGFYDFHGAKGFPIREGRAVLGNTQFWFDFGHGADSNVAYTEGVECLYTEPGAKNCHAFTGMFVDVLDPAESDWVYFQSQDPTNANHDPNDPTTWDVFFFYVGKGAFALNCIGTSCPTNP
jgi:hypothetical protein